MVETLETLEKAEKAEKAEFNTEPTAEALAQFNFEAADWLAFASFGGSQIGAFKLSVLIGRLDFEQLGGRQIW